MKVSIFSDTHTRHELITKDLSGGDLLLCSGDIMNSGRNEKDIVYFCKWFDALDYDCKVFIAGNHCRMFQDNPERALEIVHSYKTITYLQDDFIIFNGIKIYGSPWQPWFYDWAFNLPRDGAGLYSKWEMIPKDTDILLTHSPAYGILDTVEGRKSEHLGCKLLRDRVEIVKPKIHCWGHIHSGYGEEFKGNTHFFNASVLDEQYDYTQKPFNFEWDVYTNNIF